MDINNDEELEIVVGTDRGYIYVLFAKNGTDLAGYPIHVPGKILSPPTLIKLHVKSEIINRG